MKKKILLVTGLAVLAGLAYYLLKKEWPIQDTPSQGSDLTQKETGKDRSKEPYFYEIVDKQLEIFEKQKKDGKVPGLKNFQKWRAYWEPRVGKYGKFSEVSENLQEAMNSNDANGYFCSSQANWSEIGPVSFPPGTNQQRGIGRLDFVKLHPNYNGTTNQTVFAGGRPGLWKSIDNGDHWVNLNTDDFEVSTCSDVGVMNQNGTEVLLVATGKKKANWNEPQTNSIGLKRSVDAGSTWETIHLESTPWEIGNNYRVTEILVDPDNNQRVYVSVSKFSWSPVADFFGSAGADNYIGMLFVSENYGVSWNKIYEGFSIEDMEFKTDDPNVLYFSGHKLVKAVRQGSGTGTSSYHFTDLTANLGHTFNFAWDNGHASRMEVEVTASNPQCVYVLINDILGSTRSLLKSTDAGNNFTTQNNTNLTHFNWVRGSLEVSPGNEKTLYLSGNVPQGKYSVNEGISWTSISSLHDDTNDVEMYHTGTKDIIFLANDAGVYRGELDAAGNLTWVIASEGLGVAEIWDFGMSLRTNPTVPDIIEIGLQDANCMVRPTNNGDWLNSAGTSGDGMVCIVDPVDPNIIYSESQFGNIRRSTNGGLSFTPYPVAAGVNGAFVTPMVLHPVDHTRLLVGKDHVYMRRYITPTLSPQTTFTIADRPGNQEITALGVSRVGNIMYAAYESGIVQPGFGPSASNRKMKQQLFKNVNASSSWTDITPDMNGAHGTISSIEIHPADPNRVWITYQSYNSYFKVLYTEDGGTTWKDYSQGLPKVGANDIVITPTHNNTIKKCDFLYLATDFGVFYRSTSMSQWECYSDGLPNVVMTDLEIDEYQNVLRCSTFGRGVWQAGLHPDDRPYNNSAFSYQTTCAANGTTTLTVTPMDTRPNNWWALIETNGPNQTSDAASLGMIGAIQCCDENPKTFTGLDPSKYYYIKHGVYDDCHEWQETRTYIPSIQESIKADFHFEDAQGQIRTVFASGEDIYLNGMASESESGFFMDAWRRPIGSTSNFAHHADYGWTVNQEVGVLNLSHEFLNNGDNPGETFVPGFEYQIKIAVHHPPCVEWEPTTMNFTLQ